MLQNERSFTIWGENIEELKEAVERVESYMDERSGRVAIRYQVIGDEKPLPWDTGYITEEALSELEYGFIITSE